MKTGMEYPLIGLALLLVAVLGWNAWQDAQLEMSVARLNAAAAGEKLPDATLLAGEWVVKAVIGAVIGGTVTALATAAIWWARKQWQAHTQGRWQGGPNAHWGRQPAPPKPPSESEVYRMWMMQQLAQQNGGKVSRSPRMEVVDDEPAIRI